MTRQKLPQSFYNPVSLAGSAIAIISFGLILFLIVLEIFSGGQKPYMGIIAFVILPAIMIIGLLLIAYGIYREHKRERRGEVRENRFPVLNLNNPKQRRAIVIFSFGTILLLLFTTFGSFKAYEYTDSDEFCGTMCHTVMEPEFVAYQSSPHARVGCVQCHIGSGAEWYVRSKFSGAYQVYSVLFDKYSRPIETPIANLRPAQETCEQCHWPSHFYAEKMVKNTYFLSDEENTRWSLSMLMKIGGGNEEAGVTSGIHWHMNIANKVTYYTSDKQRNNIPWVKTVGKDGREVIYRAEGEEINEAEFTAENMRTMDCMDCHNRPSHQFHPSSRSINHLMAIGEISPDLPYAKSAAVQVLEKTYSSKKTALDSIRIGLVEFYGNNYPEILNNNRHLIDNTIKKVQAVYSRNYFPEMQVSWRKFPEQIGHMYSTGCFRCHDGNHVSDDGRVITNDCNACHTLLAQEFTDSTQLSLTGVDYVHPVDIGESWKEMNCSDCHKREKP